MRDTPTVERRDVLRAAGALGAGAALPTPAAAGDVDTSTVDDGWVAFGGTDDVAVVGEDT